MNIIQQVIEIITRKHYSILEETLRNKGDIGDLPLIIIVVQLKYNKLTFIENNNYIHY